MMKLINLQRYIPDEYLFGEGVQYFKDSSGKDWFESLSKFTKKYALAIDNDTGIIRSISEDVSRIYPAGLTVVETDNLPEGCDISGNWVFDGDQVSLRKMSDQELVIEAGKKQVALIAFASNKIAPLQDAKELGIASEKELEQLKAWMVYRVNLNRIDTTQLSDIEWPEPPTD